MSWQVGAFTILGLGLAAGFAWYERQRPDARVVALVATLAALAALGRIAFAAVPNVKPTTDIVLIAGFALGPGPGFAVGAVAGLTSNFFFGQGPWTPWQMAAWGATGLVGAGLGALTGRRINRWPLAAICAAAGFAFTAFQDVGDWVTYSDHSVTQLGIYVGQGLGFDAVHAVGCLLFALAFGPALVRSVVRFARRLDVSWGLRGGAVVPVALAVAAMSLLALQQSPTSSQAAPTPLGYLLSAQNPDGGFGAAAGQGSSSLFSGWAAMGLAADGVNAQQVKRGGQSLARYLASSAGSASDPGSLERTILAAHAAGMDPTAFGGRNLVAALKSEVRPNGSVQGQTNLTSFAILAFRAAGASVPSASIRWLTHQIDHDGGFNFGTSGGFSDLDDTGAALEALAGVPGSAVARVRRRATAYIERHQNPDGGFPAVPGLGSNAQSTAWAMQGLLAAGVDPNGLSRSGSSSPAQYLRSLVSSDGHIRYSRGSDQTPVWVTSQAVMALAGKTLPVSAPPLAGAARAQPPRQHHHAGKSHGAHAHQPPRTPAASVASGSSAGTSLIGAWGVLEEVLLRPIGLG